jgi:ferric iron reductase protein FhuF
MLPEVLSVVAARVSYLRASTATEGNDWYPCAQLVTDRAVLVGLVEGTMAGFGTDDPAVAASLFTQAYAFRVAGVALAAYALGLPVPEVRPEATAVRVDKPRPTQVAYLGSQVRTMDAEDLAAQLVTGHLDPFVDAVHDAFRVGERLLYGNVAASCVVAFRAVHDDDPHQHRVRERAEAFMAAAPAFDGLGAFTTVRVGSREGWYWDRTSCCLWFRTASSRYCDNCSLLDPTERSEQRARELAETVP